MQTETIQARPIEVRPEEQKEEKKESQPVDQNSRPAKEESKQVNNKEEVKQKKERKLTKKQRLFVKEYLKDLNGTQAAIRAGYSENTAQEIASENLCKPIVKAYVSEEIKKREEKVEISAEWVLKKLQSIADLCSKEYTDEFGRTAPVNSAGANRALELIGKHLGLYRDIVEQKGPGFQLVIHEDDKEKGKSEFESGGKLAETPSNNDDKQ